MPESFLHLERPEQSAILRTLGAQLSRSPVVLEKDVWVCWVLESLFTMPGRLPMAFKGGTSLSKVFRAISRFSEDVDITLDYRGLDHSFDPFAEGVSRNQLKKRSEFLKDYVREHAHGVVAPHFQERIAAEFGGGVLELEISENGEQLRLHYPTVLEEQGGYVGNSVLLEFGGRNITEPNEEHLVEPDIAEHLEELGFPRATVSVLSPARTFWEKATLMHVECQRQEFRVEAQRLSRHWYDLDRLADLPHGEAALADRDLLADVVRHKHAFYFTNWANYQACLQGGLKLIPDDAGLAALRTDFQYMASAGMFTGEPPDFEAIIARICELEKQINTSP